MTLPLFYFTAIFIFADRHSDEIIYHGVLTKQAAVWNKVEAANVTKRRQHKIRLLQSR